MNAETPTPSRASVQLNKTVEGVETMHPLPRPGKEIVRAAGKRTGRDGRNDHPLGNNTLIEMSSLRVFVQCLVSKQQNCKDIQDELVAGIGTYAIPEGMTAQTFKNGFKGTLFGAEVYEDGNITITSNDAKGGVFAKEGIVLVQGRAPWKTTRDEPSLGGGGTSVWLWDEYAYGERLAGGTTSSFVFEVYSDATAPTS